MPWDYVRAVAATMQMDLADLPSVAGWPAHIVVPQFTALDQFIDTPSQKSKISPMCLFPQKATDRSAISLANNDPWYFNTASPPNPRSKRTY